MFKRSLVCAALVLFAVSTVFAIHVSAEGERVYEMKTYTAAAGKLEALHARFRDHTAKLFQKHGMVVLGFWTPEGTDNKLVYILSYPSKEAREKSWKAFREDPDWAKARDASEVNGKLVDKVDEVYLKPTDYSPLK